jgi:chromatin segregation and condensation protein Rec8/ScpA/Scc1 (kleisin family)
MAILELMKLGEISTRQDSTFAEIYIHRRDRRGFEGDA